MDAINPINLLVSFAAGTLSFLSPCMLPLVPGYLAVLGAGEDNAAAPMRSRMRGAALFILGFSVVFVLLGVGSGFAGGAIVRARRPVEIIGGILIVVFGLTMLAERFMPAALRRRIGRELRAPAPGPAGALAFGVVFGAAWSPCIGPTLGAILTLAAAGGSATSGAILLAVFAAGLGIPFLLLAAGTGWLEQRLQSVRRHIGTIHLVSGLLLVTFGSLLALGWIGALSARLSGIPGLDI